MPTYGYDLIDPRDDKPFYVGISDEPEVRYFAHITGKVYNPKKAARIQEIIEAGMEPILRIVEGPLPRSQAEKNEAIRIRVYEAQGIVLTNIIHSRVGRVTSSRGSTPFARMLIAKEAGWEPPKIQGDDLFWLWDQHIERMKIKQSPNEELIDQFLDSIPSDMMQRALDKVLFKISILNFSD